MLKTIITRSCLLSTFSILAMALILSATQTQAAEIKAPQALVEEVTSNVLKELSNQKGSAAAVEQAIHKLILPKLDFDSMAKLVLRDEWKKANDVQKKNFIHEFQQLLIGTYSKALVRFSNEVIVFLPFVPGDKPEKLAVVKSEVKSTSGTKTPIEYKLRFKPEDGWKVYDIDIEGVSLVTNYKGNFAREISIGGLDHLIVLLKEQNEKNKATNSKA